MCHIDINNTNQIITSICLTVSYKQNTKKNYLSAGYSVASIPSFSAPCASLFLPDPIQVNFRLQLCLYTELPYKSQLDRLHYCDKCCCFALSTAWVGEMVSAVPYASVNPRWNPPLSQFYLPHSSHRASRIIFDIIILPSMCYSATAAAASEVT